MKKRWLIILALTIVTAMFANGVKDRYEVVAWQEDFEHGATGWNHYDGGVSPNNWHIYNYGGAQLNVWWMGDPALAQGANIGGYYDHQYLVLDTPARTISAAATNLTFKMATGLEAPGTSGNYNGWDAFNIRISTNGGTTWTVLQPSAPAYDFTSAYSFGFEFGEGVGVPGWGGQHAPWVSVTASLSAYVGQSVKIRFAFASDPAESTGDDPTLFGVMLDDISFGGYTNNGSNDGQMTYQSLVPLGGDLWAIAEDASAPSPTHIMKNQNAQGSYNVNMMNYLVSPPIELPADGDIRVDFMIQGNFTDPNTFPDVDYFGWEISINNGVTWFAMSNPYGSATGSNYVYSDAPPAWASMTESYTLDGYISDYAGETAMLRWYFKSDADTPSGTGIMIDDVKVYNDIFIAPPSNLEATVSGSNVTLAWDAPGTGGGGAEGWLSYDGENADAIGTGAAADFDVAAKWDATGDHGILPWVGMNITKIKFWPAEDNAICTYTPRIWTGNTGVLAYEQAVATVTADGWNEIILTTPFTIPQQSSIMAGYRCVATSGYPAGCDAGPQIEGYGNAIRWNGAWTTLTALGATLTYNWNIKIYVQDATGREYEITQIPENVQSVNNDQLTTSGVVRDREVTNYKVYRDGVQIDLIAGTLLTYTDMNVAGGLHTYYLTAMYNDNESEASNTTTAFVLPAMNVELIHDDGTAETGITVGSTHQMAVKFSYTTQVSVKYAKVYVQTLGSAGIIIRVFDNDGANGMPGTQLAQYQYPAASVTLGWNWIALPADINVADGEFYLGILETTNASAIGLDTSSNGFSYQRLATTWEPVTTGEIMIRAIVQYPVANDDNVTPALTLDASNYPNPFNPETTISFIVPKSGPASLEVYNIKGQIVRTLVNDVREAGKYTVIWNGKDNNGSSVASGLYFYRLTHDGKNITRKMLLSK
jgi:hypothetical protein